MFSCKEKEWQFFTPGRQADRLAYLGHGSGLHSVADLCPPPAESDTPLSCENKSRPMNSCFCWPLTLLLADTGNTCVAMVPVLYVVLHVEVIEEQRVSQCGIADSLIQWESWCTWKNKRLLHRNSWKCDFNRKMEDKFRVTTCWDTVS